MVTNSTTFIHDSRPHNICTHSVRKVIDSFGLVDLWKYLDLLSIQKQVLVKDAIYISRSLLEYATNIQLVKPAFTDRFILVASIQMSAIKHYRPTYVWRFNEIYLPQYYFIKLIKVTWKQI